MYPQLKLDNQLCFRFYTVSRLLTQIYSPLLKSLGITYPQYLVLMVLWEADNQPVNDIAKRLLLNTNTITPLLKRMETDGLIKRKKDKVDGRKVIVTLTKKGKLMEEQAVAIPDNLVKSITCSDFVESLPQDIFPVLDNMIVTLRQTVETMNE